MAEAASDGSSGHACGGLAHGEHMKCLCEEELNLWVGDGARDRSPGAGGIDASPRDGEKVVSERRRPRCAGRACQ